MSAFACLAIGDNAQLETLLRQESQVVAETAVQSVMDQAPLAAVPGIQVDLLPATQGATAYQALYQSSELWASHEFMLAQSELSTWHNAAAKSRLTAILDAEPNVSLRPVIAFYLSMLTGKSQDPISPERHAAMQKAEAAGPTPRIGPAVAPAAGTPKPPSVVPAKTPDPQPSTPPAPPTPTQSTPVEGPKPK